MIRYIVLLLVFTIYVASGASPTERCMNYAEDFPVHNYVLNLEHCDSSAERCPLYKGTNQTLNVTFQVSSALKGVKNKMHGIFNKEKQGWKVPYTPFPSSQQICDSTGCAESMDLVPNKEYKHHFFFHCSRNFPGVKLYVEYKLLDAQERVVFCRLIPVAILDPPQH